MRICLQGLLSVASLALAGTQIACLSSLSAEAQTADPNYYDHFADSLDGQCDYFSYSFCIDLPRYTKVARDDRIDFVVHTFTVPSGVLSGEEQSFVIYEGNQPPTEMSEPSTENDDFSSIPQVTSSLSYFENGLIRRAILFETLLERSWPRYLRVTYAAAPGIADENMQVIARSIVIYLENDYG